VKERGRVKQLNLEKRNRDEALEPLEVSGSPEPLRCPNGMSSLAEKIGQSTPRVAVDVLPAAVRAVGLAPGDTIRRLDYHVPANANAGSVRTALRTPAKLARTPTTTAITGKAA
jgi:hypothetical protein